MNLFAGALEPGPQADVLVVGDARLTLPRLGDAVRAAAARGPLTIGVRPEALRLGGAGGGAALRATTEHVELLGHETLVHLRTGDVTLTARVDGMHAAARDERVAVAFDPAALYFFAADGGAVDGPSRTTT
jgi:multiple sugar transport system ATP-binding protein